MRPQALSVILLAMAGLVGCAHGDLPDACYAKPASGDCKAAHKRFYFDSDGGRCKAFIWGGCGGNVPFETLEQCRNTCETGKAQSPLHDGGKRAPKQSTEE
jgi:hypothetical protein